MNNDNINDFVPSILRPRTIRLTEARGSLSLTQKSTFSQSSLSLRRNNNKDNATNLNESSLKRCNPLGLKRKINYSPIVTNSLPKVDVPDKENLGCTQNIVSEQLQTNPKGAESSSLPFSDIAEIRQNDIYSDSNTFSITALDLNNCRKHDDVMINSCIPSVESKKAPSEISEKTIIIGEEQCKPVISVSFSVTACDKVDISSNKSNIKKVSVEYQKDKLNVECEIVEGSHLSQVSEIENTLIMNELANEPKSPQKRKAAGINLEIKKQKLTAGEQSTEKVLILKSNAIEQLTHVIVQPPNYKKILDKSEGENGKRKSIFRSEKNGISVSGCHLKQKSIQDFLRSTKYVNKTQSLDDSAVKLINSNDRNVCEVEELVRNDAQEMNTNLGVVDVKHDGRTNYKSNRNESTKTRRLLQHSPSPKASLNASMSDVPRTLSPRSKRDSVGRSLSPRKPVESLQFNLPIKPKSNKTSIAGRNNIPHYKIVAGTHFAVDAFSYGDIPNVKHYFLTHFHSDHYSGLKKSFNKLLLCSKITADLCTSRLGVNSKCIQVINIDETIRIEGVEVTVVDANHCPGAIMLVFTLPSGKSLLHTGDCRASPTMESFPVFWNKDIHTVYLDTTYCNPRYDFPTQDQSLEMALHILRQKKMALEKAGKKFSSVLIICGTYTIGKEKFFLGMARRVGCSVWACPEKDRVLQAVEGHSFSKTSPQSCQLHVVPMRDLTHEKLRSYMDSMPGSFNEVVAFKPSGWENGKNSAVEKDSVTIHGIPYSEHSSFSELIRFVKFLKPKQVVPTVDISGGIKAVQKYFPCPLVNKDYIQCQSKLTDFFSIQNRQQASAVT